MKVEYNQKALNEIINANLDVDGDYGAKTKAAEDNFKQKLSIIFANKGYKFLYYMPIAIRMSDLFTDKMSDWACLFTPNKVMFIPISTKPASYLESETKVAVLKENQYLDSWVLKNDGWSGMVYLHQVKDVIVYRDNLVDLKITRTAPTEKGIFYINWHSWKSWLQNILWYKSTNKNIALSRGCQVGVATDWQLLTNELTKFISIGSFVSGTLINIEDFK